MKKYSQVCSLAQSHYKFLFSSHHVGNNTEAWAQGATWAALEWHSVSFIPFGES